MSSLDEAIKGFQRATDDFSRGALTILLRIRDVRDSYAHEQKQRWRDRAGHNGAMLYSMTKEVRNTLDNLMIDDANFSRVADERVRHAAR